MMEMEKKTVYIITKGDYSDYRICAVTLDPEKAKIYQAFYSDRWEDACIEEHKADEETIDTAKLISVYEVEILKDGTVKNRLQQYIAKDKYYDEDYDIPRFEFMSRNWHNGRDWDCTCFLARLRAKDEEHARKIAQDKRAEMLAQRSGI